MVNSETDSWPEIRYSDMVTSFTQLGRKSLLRAGYQVECEQELDEFYPDSHVSIISKTLIFV